jgi:hypothetical protein
VLTPVEQWRKARFERFADRQRQVRAWINFADIADYCAREDGSIAPDETKRALAFDTLAQSLLNGEFDQNGRSQVLFFNHCTKKARLTREDLRDIVAGDYDGARGLLAYLPHCWARRETIERWLENHRLPVPSWLAPAPSHTRAPSLAERTAIELSKMFPDGKPAMKGKEIANALKARDEFGEISARTLQRAIASIWPK